MPVRFFKKFMYIGTLEEAQKLLRKAEKSLNSNLETTADEGEYSKRPRRKKALRETRSRSSSFSSDKSSLVSSPGNKVQIPSSKFGAIKPCRGMDLIFSF